MIELARQESLAILIRMCESLGKSSQYRLDTVSYKNE